MEVSRRRVNTYGKATKKILVHDLFNVGSKTSSLYDPVRPPTIDHFLRTRTGTPLSDFSEDPETSRQLNHELQASFDKSRASSVGPSVRSNSHAPADELSPAVFDLESSQDEMPKSKKPTKIYKRRKLAVNPANAASSDVESQGTSSPRMSEDIWGGELGRTTVLERNRAAENKSLRQSDNVAAKMSRVKATVKARQDPDPIAPSKLSPSSTTEAHRSPLRIGSPASDKSSESMVSTRSTPKRKRGTADDVLSDVSSPSQLELSALRLTPARRSHHKARSIDLEQSDSSMTSPSRNRRRMVDKLDSARTHSTTRDVGMKDSSPRPSKARKIAPEPTAPSLLSLSSSSAKDDSQPQLLRDGSSYTGSAAPKIRTYGKQRSHLKDVVTGLDSQSQTSSQTSLQQLVSQVDSLTSAKDQYDMESEEEDPGTQLKSIHELRQAGLANRFDRDLEALFEDIESGNKALRIQGLMQLVRRLQEQSFKRMLLESGKLHRLTSVSQSGLDMTSTSVLLLALWALVVSETATAQSLSQIYNALLGLPTRIIEETRSVSRIARDRKQNLSKALVRDLADFEGHVVDQSLSGSRQASKTIIISRVSLRCLEYTLKRIIELAEPVPEPGADLIDAVARAIATHLKALSEGDTKAEHIESIRLLVLWLEMTAATSKNVIHAMSAAQFSSIGQTLAEVMSWSRDENSAIEQSCIRSAVELSNGNPAICDQFTRTALVEELFKVIEEHFSHLVKDDAEENQADETKLGSVILALGCLLNLTDHSANGRAIMMEKREDGRSQLDVLVNFFKQHVDETDEAVSEAQIQLLIPFGYVVLLLCTLCLDDLVRAHVATNIEGNGLEELVNKAEIFLSRMKAVDSDSFVERFSTTIDTVRGTLMCS